MREREREKEGPGERIGDEDDGREMTRGKER